MYEYSLASDVPHSPFLSHSAPILISRRPAVGYKRGSVDPLETFSRDPLASSARFV